jgi:hypothetical protein
MTRLRLHETPFLCVHQTGSRPVLESLNAVLSPDGLAVTIVGDKPQLIEKGADGVSLKAFAEKVALLDFDTVQRDIERALGSLKDDPEDAVTSACSLIEAVCRSILIELSIPLPAKKDIDGLVRAVQEPLGLSPGRSDLLPEIEADVRQILGGLTSVTKGIGALRTHGGDAHGRERGYRRIDSRIARLSINSAGCLAMFLIETWEHKHHRALKFQQKGCNSTLFYHRLYEHPHLLCNYNASIAQQLYD